MEEPEKYDDVSLQPMVDLSLEPEDRKRRMKRANNKIEPVQEDPYMPTTIQSVDQDDASSMADEEVSQ